MNIYCESVKALFRSSEWINCHTFYFEGPTMTSLKRTGCKKSEEAELQNHAAELQNQWARLQNQAAELQWAGLQNQAAELQRAPETGSRIYLAAIVNCIQSPKSKTFQQFSLPLVFAMHTSISYIITMQGLLKSEGLKSSGFQWLVVDGSQERNRSHTFVLANKPTA